VWLIYGLQGVCSFEKGGVYVPVRNRTHDKILVISELLSV
jgi:hypothetical protein